MKINTENSLPCAGKFDIIKYIINEIWWVSINAGDYRENFRGKLRLRKWFS